MLVVPPYSLTSLNCRAHSLLESGSGGSGLNCPGLFSRNGCTDPNQGVCGTKNPGGVRRQTPGPGAFVSNNEVVPTGVRRPSPVRRPMIPCAAAKPTLVPFPASPVHPFKFDAESASA